MTADSDRFKPYAWDLHTEVNRYPGLTDDVRTVPDHVRKSVAKAMAETPHRPGLIQNDKQWSYDQFLENIEKTALAFVNLGMEPLEGIGIIGFNSPEWIFSFFASMFAGGFAVGIYSTNNGNACAHVIEDSGCPIVVSQDKKQTDKILSILPKVPKLKVISRYRHSITKCSIRCIDLFLFKVIVQYQGSVKESREKLEGQSDLKLMTWEEMMADYASDYSPKPEKVMEREQKVSPYRCCTLVYTSGTTGNPKGAILTHANYMSMLFSVMRSGQKCWDNSKDLKLITYLPLSHIMAQVTDIGTTFTLGGKQLFNHIKTFRDF